jgi:hypothetical protein
MDHQDRTLLTLDFSDLERRPIDPDALGRAVDELLQSSPPPPPPTLREMFPTFHKFFSSVEKDVGGIDPEPPTLPRATRPQRQPTQIGVAPQANPTSRLPSIPPPPLPRVTRPPRMPTQIGVAPQANGPIHASSAPPTLPRVTRPPRMPTQIGVAPQANAPTRLPSLPLPPLPRHIE